MQYIELFYIKLYRMSNKSKSLFSSKRNIASSGVPAAFSSASNSSTPATSGSSIPTAPKISEKITKINEGNKNIIY
jgi:hypothetical protein